MYIANHIAVIGCVKRWVSHTCSAGPGVRIHTKLRYACYATIVVALSVVVVVVVASVGTAVAVSSFFLACGLRVDVCHCRMQPLSLFLVLFLRFLELFLGILRILPRLFIASW